jgi:phosphoglycerate dehydrogenase-like enzyme
MPLPPEHPLWREPNVIVTPILGGMSDVYLHQAWPLLRHNITCFAADRWADMVNPVSRVL